MSYYIIVDQCPSCRYLQERWVVQVQSAETVSECNNCSVDFSLSQNMFQIKFNETP